MPKTKGKFLYFNFNIYNVKITELGSYFNFSTIELIYVKENNSFKLLGSFNYDIKNNKNSI